MGKITFVLCGLMLMGCASGHCRGRSVGSEKHVFVYKPDGSKQCDKKKNVISADVMSDEFKEITIYSKENKSDGQMHITLCGVPTGRVNVYEIQLKDLEKAKTLGFKEVKSDN